MLKFTDYTRNLQREPVSPAKAEENKQVAEKLKSLAAEHPVEIWTAKAPEPQSSQAEAEDRVKIIGQNGSTTRVRKSDLARWIEAGWKVVE